MGAPSYCEIGDNLVFSITCHDPDTGVLTDADGAPAYRVYENEGTTALLTGIMTEMVDAGGAGNTTGFYTESIAVTTGNSFEAEKTYTIYIEATVDSDKGGICYGFKAKTPLATVVNAQVLDVMNTDTFAEPGQEAPTATTTLVNKISYIYKFMRNQIWTTATKINVYNDAADTVDQKSTISDDATTFKRGEFESGP